MTARSVSSRHVSALSCCEANSVGDWMLISSHFCSLRPAARNSSKVPVKHSSVGAA